MASVSMGLASGGRIKQQIDRDSNDTEMYDFNAGKRIFIHFINAGAWKQITGRPAETPVDKNVYRKQKLPWFELYNEPEPAKGLGAGFSQIKSVNDIDTSGSVSRVQVDDEEKTEDERLFSQRWEKSNGKIVGLDHGKIGVDFDGKPPFVHATRKERPTPVISATAPSLTEASRVESESDQASQCQLLPLRKVPANATYHNPEDWRPSLSQQEQQAISALHTLLDASVALKTTVGVLQHQATKLGLCNPVAGSWTDNELRCLVFSDNASVASVFEECLPSSHGQGHRLVYDPAIRLARELPASHLFLLASIAACLNDIVFHLSKRMNLESLVLTLDKLSIYGPNGHFSSHKDTPKSALHVGTVLLGLPTAHTGGALLVGQGDNIVRHDWSTLEKDKLGWVFFYADVDHEVEVVQSGYRATLQFNAYRRPAYDDSPSAQWPAERNVMDGQLSKILQDRSFLPLGGRLAFLLKHEYPVANLDTADIKNYGRQDKALSPETFLRTLKGIDESLLVSLRRNHLKCRPIVVYRDDTFAEYYEDSSEGGDVNEDGDEELHGQGWGHESAEDLGQGWGKMTQKKTQPKTKRTPKPSDNQSSYQKNVKGAYNGTGAGRYISYSLINADPGYMGYCEGYGEDVNETLECMNAVVDKSLVWGPPPAAFNYKTHGAPYGTYGNEPSTAYTYAKMGLVVELPSWEERGKGVPAESAPDA